MTRSGEKLQNMDDWLRPAKGYQLAVIARRPPTSKTALPEANISASSYNRALEHPDAEKWKAAIVKETQ